MTELFPLALFPPGSLRESVVTTVWVGVMVCCFFNLRLGWTFSGLVVPGYLVPLIMSKPISSAIVVIEGILTYCLVRFISDYILPRFHVSYFFGRDRFFALFIGSVIVRLIMDGYILNQVGMVLVNNWNIQVSMQSDLHSFGTVISALIANSLWKPGLIKGSLCVGITTTITYLITLYILIPLTNFNIGNLFYLYEDIALSFHASPKAYIVLITTAFLASRLNLIYGWEFSGILLPSLLALQWYQPHKILTSLAEAFLIVLCSYAILKHPFFKNSTIEGSRKLLLFFNISFALKYIFGFVIAWTAPHIYVTDYFGFGYLLPTLLAIKIYDKHIPLKIPLATAQTSLAGATLGSFAGLALMFLPTETNDYTKLTLETSPTAIREIQQPLESAISQQKILVYKTQIPDSVPTPTSRDLMLFESAVQHLRTYIQSSSPNDLRIAKAILRDVGYQITLYNKTHLVLAESSEYRGWGSFVLSLHSKTPLLIEVPAPISENLSLEAALAIYLYFDASAFAVAGSTLYANRNQSMNILQNPNTFYNIFHREFTNNNTLVIRGHTQKSKRLLHKHKKSDPRLDTVPSELWVKKRLPEGFNLKKLQNILGDYAIHWGRQTIRTHQASTAGPGYAELWLNYQDRRSLLFRPWMNTTEIESVSQDTRIDGYLAEWLLNTKNNIAPKGSNSYQAPSLEKLLFFDTEIINPIMNLVTNSTHASIELDEFQNKLKTINRAASVLHYEVFVYHHIISQQSYLILHEKPSIRRRYWGTFVFRIGKATPALVQIPRPLYDKSSFEFGVTFFELHTAQALIISGSHRFANTDGSADILAASNKKNMFNTATQSILKYFSNVPINLYHIRAASARDAFGNPRQEDIIISSAAGILPQAVAAKHHQSLLRTVAPMKLRYTFAEGTQKTAGYEAWQLMQAQYLTQTNNAQLTILWVSPEARKRFRQLDIDSAEHATMTEVGLPIRSYDLRTKLSNSQQAIPLTSLLPGDLVSALNQFAQTHDINALAYSQKYKDKYTFEYVIDKVSQQSFIVLQDRKQQFALFRVHAPILTPATQRIAQPLVSVSELISYINSGTRWLPRQGGAP